MSEKMAANNSQNVRALRTDYASLSVITTRWMDNDIYGHVNNVIYYSFFDTAVNGLLIKAGVLDPSGGKVIGLVVETGCRYSKPIAFPEPIEAGVRVARLGSSSVRYEIGLFKSGETQAVAEGYFSHVYVDRDSRRPTPLPDMLRAYLETLVVKHSA